MQFKVHVWEFWVLCVTIYFNKLDILLNGLENGWILAIS